MDDADILNLFSEPNTKKAVLSLFVVGSLEKVPGVRPLESDVAALSANLVDLKHQMQFVQKSLTNCLSNITSEKSERMASVEPWRGARFLS